MSCSRSASGSRRLAGGELPTRCGSGSGGRFRRPMPGGASTRRGARSRRSRSGDGVSTNGNGAAAASGDRPRVATYKDLGSFQLLLSLQDDEALRLFCDSILGPIEASEGHYGGELMRSLEAFIEENGQWERAARRLYCHRHTLRYRIRRVEELTGPEPRDGPRSDRVLAGAARPAASELSRLFMNVRYEPGRRS